jgi:glutamate racemase
LNGPIGGPANADRPIGVFDSGVGGLSILRALRAELPHEHFVYYADTAHAPYGERSEDFVIERARAVVHALREEHAIKALVIACNTATAAAVHLVRAEQRDLPVVGVEPALKPALAASTTKRIGVLATRRTLASAKFLALHEALRSQAEFVLQPCDGLADAIERDDTRRVAQLCETYTAAIGRFGSSTGEIDTLVLGCTHYPFALAPLRARLGVHVKLIETGQPVAAQARRVLAASGALRLARAEGVVEFRASGSDTAVRAAAARWL